MTTSKATSTSQLHTLKYDLRASAVVFLVALPLCLGIALASGAPLFSGIIAGVVGGIVVGALSGSSLSVSGPAAGLTVIVLNALEKLGHFETFLLAVLLAGVIQLILGFIKAGGISHFFPSAVIKGMLAAIGITLILKQIPHALGFDRDPEGEFVFLQQDGENTFSEILQAIYFVAPGAVVITLLSIGILLLWQRPEVQRFAFFKQVPSALVVVVVGILLNHFYTAAMPQWALATNHLVALPTPQGLNGFSSLFTNAGFNGFLSLFTLPDFSQITNSAVYITAVTIAVVASLETLLNLEATDKLDPLKRHSPPNKELKAQGVGNIISGLLGGLPLTSVIVRSSVNINSGARSKLSAILHGVLLLVCVVSIPGLLNQIPLACLAAILLVTGYKLAKIGLFREMFRLGYDQFLPFVVTILAVLFTDLLMGIGIGMAVGIFFILRANYKTSYFFHRQPTPETDRIKINLSEHVSFLNKASIIQILNGLPENSYVEIDGSQSEYIDYDVMEVIDDFRRTAEGRNIELTFIAPKTGAGEKSSAKAAARTDIAQEQVDMRSYRALFENNRKWVGERLKLSPGYFEELAKGQQPTFLFISCSDSRISASEITGTNPGEMFVHRNIANMVVSTDLNLLSVLQYAVEVLKVQHVIVCGHYGCGGVKAAMGHQDLGLINKWLHNIKDVYRLHRAELSAIQSEEDRFKRLVELNVVEQVYNLHKTAIVQKAWREGAALHVHGWVYDLREGLIRDLAIDAAKSFAEYDEIYRYDAPTGHAHAPVPAPVPASNGTSTPAH